MVISMAQMKEMIRAGVFASAAGDRVSVDDEGTIITKGSDAAVVDLDFGRAGLYFHSESNNPLLESSHLGTPSPEEAE